MEIKEIHELEESQHEHLLMLEDLQLIFQDYVEDDDEIDDDDMIARQNFKRTCDICGLGIDWYHRYYHKCSESLCNYSLHKFCAQIPTTLQFPAHPHPLHTLLLKKGSNSWSCHACHTKHKHDICYHCSTCDYEIDLGCVTFVEQTTIHHPGHPHTLVSPTVDPILSMCNACGKKHEGVFYHCNTCFNFSIHVDCVTIPFKILLQNLHTHMLTLSCSFSVIPDNSKCRICRMNISDRVWLYKCSKCRYYAHLDCATSRGEPFMSILSRGTGKNDTNFIALDYPDLLHYPLPDESYSILPHQVRRGKDHRDFDQISIDDKGFYTHKTHEHPLLFVNTTDTSILGIQPDVCLHDPMKRIKVICNGCVRPITTQPFYVCKGVDEGGCNFYLHEWCAKLPMKLQNHPLHSHHTLHLYDSQQLTRIGFLTSEVIFECHICRLTCNGFGYRCYICFDYHVDVNCAFIPREITHEAHANHLLSLIQSTTSSSTPTCLACDKRIDENICFKCRSCDFYLDTRCALYLPETIKNKYDKHPLKLSYFPIENHKSEYFCEVCEEGLNPEKWFYHCLECGQSIHSACAPLILQSEQDVNSSNHVEGVYTFLNLKFDLGSYKFRRLHQHSLSFLAGVKSEERCDLCKGELQSYLIFKCLICKYYAVHVICARRWTVSLAFAPLEILRSALRSNIIKPEENITQQRPHAALTFYPKGAVRPVTGQSYR